MASMYLQTTIIISVINTIKCQTCNYGDFKTTDNGVCIFNCLDSNVNISTSSVSFTAIKNECNNVKLAAEFFDCTMDDLVWSSESCGCPSCICSSSDYEPIHQSLSYSTAASFGGYAPHSTCYNCSCTSSTDTTISDLIYSCSKLASSGVDSYIRDIEEWENFKCPPEKCMDNDGDIRETWDSWWEHVEDGEDCDTFCYCSAMNGTICATGFESIIGQDEQLTNAFYDQCSWNNNYRPLSASVGVKCIFESIHSKSYLFESINFQPSDYKQPQICILIIPSVMILILNHMIYQDYMHLIPVQFVQEDVPVVHALLEK